MRLGGVTRNAVIGRIHRMGLSGRKQTQRIKRSGDNVRRLMTRRSRLQSIADYADAAARLGEAHHQAHAGPDIDVPEVERVHLLDLEPHHCRWPYGDGPYMFCGKTKVSGKSYCEFHVLRSLPAPTTHYGSRTPGSNNVAWRKASLNVKDPVGSLYCADLRTLEILDKEPA